METAIGEYLSEAVVFVAMLAAPILLAVLAWHGIQHTRDEQEAKRVGRQPNKGSRAR